MAHGTKGQKARVAFMGIALAMVLAGCATSPYAGYERAGEAARHLVKEGKWSEQAAAQIVIDQSPYERGGIIPKESVPIILGLAIHCQDSVGDQLSGGAQTAAWAVGVNGTLMFAEGFGASTAVSIASQAPQVIGVPGSDPITVSNPIGDMEHGIKTLVRLYPLQSVLPDSHLEVVLAAQAEARTIGQCVVKHWDEYVVKHPEFFGTDVFIAENGKDVFGSEPKNLEKPEQKPAEKK